MNNLQFWDIYNGFVKLKINGINIMRGLDYLATAIINLIQTK